jgi:hypothetical protein
VLTHVSAAHLRGHLQADQLRLQSEIGMRDDVDLARRVNDVDGFGVVGEEEVLLVVGWPQQRVVGSIDEVRMGVGNVSVRYFATGLCLNLEGDLCFIGVDSDTLLVESN